MILLELTFVLSKRYRWKFILHIEKYLFQHHLHKNYFFSPLNHLCTSFENQLTIYMWVFFWLASLWWSMDLFTCFDTSTTLFWLLWIYASKSGNVHSPSLSFIEVVRLFSVFCVSTWILELSVSTEKSAGTLIALNL